VGATSTTSGKKQYYFDTPYDAVDEKKNSSPEPIDVPNVNSNDVNANSNTVNVVQVDKAPLPVSVRTVTAADKVTVSDKYSLVQNTQSGNYYDAATTAQNDATAQDKMSATRTKSMTGSDFTATVVNEHGEATRKMKHILNIKTES